MRHPHRRLTSNATQAGMSGLQQNRIALIKIQSIICSDAHASLPSSCSLSLAALGWRNACLKLPSRGAGEGSGLEVG